MTPEEMARETESDAGVAVVLDGLNKLGGEITKTRKEAAEKAEATERKLTVALETLESKTNKSMEDVIDRLGRLKEFSGVLGKAITVTAGDDQLKSVVSQHVKSLAGHFEAAASKVPKSSPLSDATVYMATHEWFSSSTKSQLRKFAATAGENAQRAEKLYAALQEKQYGAGWEAVTKASLQEDAATEGGNLVPTIVEADVVRQVKDAGILFPLARQVQMTKKTHAMPNESAAVTVNWVAEEGTLTAGEPTFGQKTLTAKKLAGRATMSIELVEDSNVGLLAYLLEVFTEKMAGELDRQLVLGDASGPVITGINAASGINVVASSGTAAGRNLTWQLLVDTWVAAGESSQIQRGVWIMSPRGVALCIGMSDTAGQPVIRYGNAEGAPAMTILGRPMLFSNRWGGGGTDPASLDDATNDNTRIIYGVPSSLLFGTRQGMRWDVTDQVNWATYQIDARLVGRFAMVVGVPSDFNRITKLNTPAF